MKHNAPFIVAGTLALGALACSFTFDLPSIGGGDADTGPLMSRELSIPIPEQEPADLRLAFAAGELDVAPGAEGNLVEGTASWNIDQLEPDVQTEGRRVVLASGQVENLTDLQFNFDLNFGQNVTNRWDLRLAAVPMDLTVSAGAYEGEFELGGLSLRSLEVSSGASEVGIGFSEPNQIEMEEFRYNTGASTVHLTNLGNARFERLRFQGGAGEYILDMGDRLQREGEITIDAALSNIVLVIPQDMNVQMAVEGAAANVDLPDGFSRSGNRYTQEGSGPALTIRIQIGAGEVEVRRP
ncbi:MAG: toast rack family protein [Anaerolineales bacterium]|nr:toast rack family protein [Anaerolineales bacterium]